MYETEWRLRSCLYGYDSAPSLAAVHDFAFARAQGPIDIIIVVVSVNSAFVRRSSNLRRLPAWDKV